MCIYKTMFLHFLQYAGLQFGCSASNDVPSCRPVTNSINPNHLAGPCLNWTAWHGIENSLVAEMCRLAQACWNYWPLEASFVSAPCANTTPFLFLLISTRLAWLWDWGCGWASPARLTKRSCNLSFYSSSMLAETCGKKVKRKSRGRWQERDDAGFPLFS